ncbi:GTPase HflX [Tepidimonas thermarum]|uniref:GTPase HflX n=1 Tax=Tepidimonas thermarum TaxID=335431 RepID=A0A554X7I2_9BURK|nr:GTPase HflX [Tepidimonas thermarum]TSE31798.1 GTPase HflX [Tepidimonas thermarum]
MTRTDPASTAGDPAPGVILVGVDIGQPHFDATLEELALLAQSAGYRVCDKVVCRRRAPDAALYVGSGKADEIRTLAAAHGAQEVLFDQALSPAQQRNLERHLQMPVNDRILLILDIFAQRARSHEGKLQVELARLQYLQTRLVRRWSHLERQSGGIGLRGGPGETQIELDRRMIADAIHRTRERLERVKRQRRTQRRQRERRGTFNISLVGYTNAGKSTLFNALVKARAYAADQLFATLDTTTRQMYLGEVGCSVSLSDTVGFIRDLPHTLVEAFAATLQEARDADGLLHVVDASNPQHPEQIDNVMRVLHEIGAADVPQVLVFNKVDALPPQRRPHQAQDTMELEGRRVTRVFVSAQTGKGLATLRAVLADAVRGSATMPVHHEDAPQFGTIEPPSNDRRFHP